MDSHHQYLLISDVHLTETYLGTDPAWFTYKDPLARQDAEILELLALVETQCPRSFDGTRVIFNGDTWDFDTVLSRPGKPTTVAVGLSSTIPYSVFKMRRLADAHPRLIAGLAAFLGRGNEVIFVMGNHDRELAFVEVQEVLRRRLVAAAPPGLGSKVAAAISFEPWFVYVPGVLYSEHGQQYDATCSYRDVLHPFAKADRKHEVEIESSLGSVLSRRLLPRLGTFNPFDDDSFLNSFWGYFMEAVRHYWGRRPYLMVYLGESLRAYGEMRRRRLRALQPEEDTASRYVEYAKRKGVSEEFISLIHRLSSMPIVDRIPPLVHELWLDRVAVIGLSVITFLVALLHSETWVEKLLLVSLVPPLAFVVRALGRGSVALQERGRWGLVAEHVGGKLQVPVVAFGHSHRPERRPLRYGGRYYNLGTWAPVRPDLPDAGAGSLLAARRFLLVRPFRDGRTYVAFEHWKSRADRELVAEGS